VKAASKVTGSVGEGARAVASGADNRDGSEVSAVAMGVERVTTSTLDGRTSQARYSVAGDLA
jgi:hypothetical protein